MIRNFKQTAAQLLRNDHNTYRHLVRVHCAITSGVWLLLFIISYFLQYFTPKGGLSSLGMHSLIITIQVSLILLGLFITPFWETGLTFISQEFIHGRRCIGKNLTEGFFHLKSITGSMVFQGIQYVFVYFISGSLTSLVLTLLPFSQVFYSDIITLMEEPSTPLKGRMLIAAAVYSFFFLLILLYLFLRVLYRYRVTKRIILDDEQLGGAKASFQSRVFMKGNRMKLLKLDLSYWWFYLPQYMGIILPIGVLFICGFEKGLSVKEEAILWLIAACSLLIRSLIHFFAKHKVSVVYALFYDQLLKQNNSTTQS